MQVSFFSEKLSSFSRLVGFICRLHIFRFFCSLRVVCSSWKKFLAIVPQLDNKKILFLSRIFAMLIFFPPGFNFEHWRFIMNFSIPRVPLPANPRGIDDIGGGGGDLPPLGKGGAGGWDSSAKAPTEKDRRPIDTGFENNYVCQKEISSSSFFWKCANLIIWICFMFCMIVIIYDQLLSTRSHVPAS